MTLNAAFELSGLARREMPILSRELRTQTRPVSVDGRRTSDSERLLKNCSRQLCIKLIIVRFGITAKQTRNPVSCCRLKAHTLFVWRFRVQPPPHTHRQQAFRQLFTLALITANVVWKREIRQLWRSSGKNQHESVKKNKHSRAENEARPWALPAFSSSRMCLFLTAV